MDEILLRVENITKRFGGVVALDDVSFTVNKGECVTLVGENGSGKSTMIKIISGIYSPDSGSLFINNKQYTKISPIESLNEGIQVIYQDFSSFPNLSVAENIAINNLVISNTRFVDWKHIKSLAQEGLNKVKVHIPLDALVGDLSAADRQIIAIAKALLADAKLIIMDEPTTTLTRKEVKQLFKVINDVNAQGISTIFVSHKLAEIREIGQRTIIFRNGQKVVDLPSKDLDIKTIEYHMTGHSIDISNLKYSEPKLEEIVLSVEGFTRANAFTDVSFQLHRNEVLGVTGLLGSGRTELALALFGQHPADSGTIILEKKKIKIKSIFDATSNGIGFVPEDRLKEGLFLPQSINNNISAKIIDSLKNKFNFIDGKKKSELSAEWIRRLKVKTPSDELPASSLSGGNQQRLVLAKWLAFNPKVLILNSPTVGVDVGSKTEIHDLIRELASTGMGVILMSDDIPELMHTCNRILMMRKGRIVGDYLREKVDEEELNRQLIADTDPVRVGQEG